MSLHCSRLDGRTAVQWPKLCGAICTVQNRLLAVLRRKKTTIVILHRASRGANLGSLCQTQPLSLKFHRSKINYISYLTPIPSCFHPTSQFISVLAGKFSNHETGTQCRSRLWHEPTGEKSENRRYDNNDNGKRCSGNHSKPGWMDKSGEAEEEERGQGGLETRCAFAFFLS